MSIDYGSFEVLTFDCYGTLIDWEQGILSSLQPILAAHGISVTEQDVLEHYAGIEAKVEAGPYVSYAEVLRSVLKGFGAHFDFSPTADELSQFAVCVRDWPPFPDSHAALQSLQTRYGLVILSNVDDDLFEHSREKLGVDFDRVFTAQQIGSYKPSPRNFRYALEHLDQSPERVLHVAQSLFHDIKPAKELGLSTVWVNRRRGLGGSGATPPAEVKADAEVPDLRSLVTLVGLAE
ncbi:MAG: haloacid dehalogenase type II [Planctomycetota bacterium]